MDCHLASADGLTFTCRRCGRVIVCRTPTDPSRLHFQCRRKAARQPTITPSIPPKSRSVPPAEANLQVLLATIRVTALSPPWHAIERYARHVCETGAWAGCDRGRHEWARRVMEMAAKPGLWPAAWGPYPSEDHGGPS